MGLVLQICLVAVLLGNACSLLKKVQFQNDLKENSAKDRIIHKGVKLNQDVPFDLRQVLTSLPGSNLKLGSNQLKKEFGIGLKRLPRLRSDPIIESYQNIDSPTTFRIYNRLRYLLSQSPEEMKPHFQPEQHFGIRKKRQIERPDGNIFSKVVKGQDPFSSNSAVDIPGRSLDSAHAHFIDFWLQNPDSFLSDSPFGPNGSPHTPPHNPPPILDGEPSQTSQGLHPTEQNPFSSVKKPHMPDFISPFETDLPTHLKHAVSPSFPDSMAKNQAASQTQRQSQQKTKPKPKSEVPQSQQKTKQMPKSEVPQSQQKTKPKPKSAVPQSQQKTKPNPNSAVPQSQSQQITKPKPKSAVPQSQSQQITKPKPKSTVPQSQQKTKPKPKSTVPLSQSQQMTKPKQNSAVPQSQSQQMTKPNPKSAVPQSQSQQLTKPKPNSAVSQSQSQQIIKPKPNSAVPQSQSQKMTKPKPKSAVPQSQRQQKSKTKPKANPKPKQNSEVPQRKRQRANTFSFRSDIAPSFAFRRKPAPNKFSNIFEFPRAQQSSQAKQEQQEIVRETNFVSRTNQAETSSKPETKVKQISANESTSRATKQSINKGPPTIEVTNEKKPQKNKGTNSNPDMFNINLTKPQIRKQIRLALSENRKPTTNKLKKQKDPQVEKKVLANINARQQAEARGANFVQTTGQPEVNARPKATPKRKTNEVSTATIKQTHKRPPPIEIPTTRPPPPIEVVAVESTVTPVITTMSRKQTREQARLAQREAQRQKALERKKKKQLEAAKRREARLRARQERKRKRQEARQAWLEKMRQKQEERRRMREERRMKRKEARRLAVERARARWMAKMQKKEQGNKNSTNEKQNVRRKSTSNQQRRRNQRRRRKNRRQNVNNKQINTTLNKQNNKTSVNGRKPL